LIIPNKNKDCYTKLILGKNGTSKNDTGKNGTGNSGTGNNGTGNNGTNGKVGENGTIVLNFSKPPILKP